jgi:hypothetical protein
MSENKTNLIMAVRGYKSVRKQRNAKFTDVTALDSSNNKVLLRIIAPLTNEYTGIYEVKNMSETIKRDNYDSAILISNQFTDNALEEMSKQEIQHISEDHMPPFDIKDLYLAIVSGASSICHEKCGKVGLATTECNEKVADSCKIKMLVVAAKRHFEEGTIGMLKNDLKVALALAR